jgi:hypothetical protein
MAPPPGPGPEPLPLRWRNHPISTFGSASSLSSQSAAADGTNLLAAPAAVSSAAAEEAVALAAAEAAAAAAVAAAPATRAADQSDHEAAQGRAALVLLPSERTGRSGLDSPAPCAIVAGGGALRRQRVSYFGGRGNSAAKGGCCLPAFLRSPRPRRDCLFKAQLAACRTANNKGGARPGARQEGGRAGRLPRPCPQSSWCGVLFSCLSSTADSLRGRRAGRTASKILNGRLRVWERNGMLRSN